MSEREKEKQKEPSIFRADNMIGGVVDSVMNPVREGIANTLERIPLVGAPLAVIVDGALGIVQGAIGLATNIVGGILKFLFGWMLPDNVDPMEGLNKNGDGKESAEKTQDEEQAEKQMSAGLSGPDVEKLLEKAGELFRGDKAAEEIPDFDTLEETLKQEKAPTPEELKKDAQQRAAREKEAEHLESHYAGGEKNIFKKSAEDVYSPGEDEPAMKQFVKQVDAYDAQSKDWESKLNQEGLFGKPFLNDGDFEAMADSIYGKMLDQSMRRARNVSKNPEAPGMKEQQIRNTLKKNPQSDVLKMPEQQKKDMIRNLKQMRQSDPQALKKMLKNPRSPEFRNLEKSTMESIRNSQVREKNAKQVQNEKGPRTRRNTEVKKNANSAAKQNSAPAVKQRTNSSANSIPVKINNTRTL